MDRLLCDVARRLARTCAVLCSLAQAPAQRVPDIRLDTDVPGSATSRVPQIAASGDAVYVVWQEARDGPPYDVYVNVSRDRGATWLASDRRIDTATPPGVSNEFDPRIAADGDAVYVVWRRVTPVPTGAFDDIYCNRSLDRGATWLPSETRLNVGSAPVTVTVENARIAASGSLVCAVWQDRRSGSSDVFCNRSLDRGTTWQGDVRLDTDVAGRESSLYPEVAIAGDAVYVVWWDYRDGGAHIRFNRSLDRGATWLSSDVRISAPSGGSFAWRSQLAASDDAVYVVWEDGSNGRPDVFFDRSLDRGTTWLPSAVRLDTGDPPGRAWSFFPQIVAQGSNVYVAWFDERNAIDRYDDVFFNRSLDRGTTWLPSDVRLDTDPPGSAASFDVRLAASGPAVYAVWWDRRNSLPGDIYYNRSLDAGATWLAADRRINTGSAPGANAVDWPGVAASGPAAWVVWGDGRSGSADVYCNIPFGLLRYGTGNAGAGGFVPSLDADGMATIGSAVSLSLTRATGGAAAALLVGGAKASVPILGATLLVQPWGVLGLVVRGPAVPGAGFQHAPFTLPPAPALVGAVLMFQVALIDPAAIGGLTMSNAIELWIG